MKEAHNQRVEKDANIGCALPIKDFGAPLTPDVNIADPNILISS